MLIGVAALIAILGLLVFGRLLFSPTSMLAGQSNLQLTFYGRAVDENGNGIAGASFSFDIEAYPADWTFQTRGRDYVRSIVVTRSDEHGDFKIDINGCMIRVRSATATGYRELYELDSGTRRDDGWNSVFTRSIRLISWSDPQYRSDPERPAIFVFVSDGAQSASALPSQGGFRSEGRDRWIANRPGWPRKPSLDDVDWVDGPPRRNVSVPLVFKAVDTHGKPMADVEIAFEVRRYRTLKEMRSDHYNPKARTETKREVVTTGRNGLARATADAFRLESITRAQVKGTKFSEGPSSAALNNRSFYARDLMNSQGEQIFRCDEQSPITIVMVRRDEEVTHVLPDRGGYERGGEADAWQRTQPASPHDLHGRVRYVAPGATTLPADPTTRSAE